MLQCLSNVRQTNEKSELCMKPYSNELLNFTNLFKATYLKNNVNAYL